MFLSTVQIRRWWHGARGRRAGRSYEGEARSGMVELAIKMETETACDGEWWAEGRGREPEEMLRLVAACVRRWFKPVLLGDVGQEDGWEPCGSGFCCLCENGTFHLCMEEFPGHPVCKSSRWGVIRLLITCFMQWCMGDQNTATC